MTIGITLFMEGTHKEVQKAYIYLPMDLRSFVEILQLRYEHNRKKKALRAGAQENNPV